MAREKEDFPPLLPAGQHIYSVESLRKMCVSDFALSTTREEIMRGFDRIYGEIVRLKIPCDIVFDGSFLNEEIDQDDIDFAVVVTPEYYESCPPEQRDYLDWIGDDKTIKATHLCDCYLCVEFPQSHPDYFEGLTDRDWWVNHFALSTIYKRVRGVAIIRVA